MKLVSSSARQGHVQDGRSGFTLIELLVVIAIIGILSSVVLASLNTARNKGADAAIKSNIDNARAQAELYYDNTGQTYLGVCLAATGIAPMVAGVNSAAGAGAAICNDTGGPPSAWRLYAQLKAPSVTSYFCTDNTGTSTIKTTVPTAGTFTC
jgi:prepilin-type N-terminal cleavage/methylation domain-containing protein